MFDDKDKLKELAENLKKMLNVPNTKKPDDIKTAAEEIEFARVASIFSIDYGIRLTSHVFENNNSCLYDKEVFFGALRETLIAISTGDLTLVPSYSEIIRDKEDIIKKMGFTEEGVRSSETLARRLEKLVCQSYLAEMEHLAQFREDE